MPKPDKDNTKKFITVSPMIIAAKILNKILSSQIQQYIKRITDHNLVQFIPGTRPLFT
jgi:hypothetical protein